MRLFLPLEDKHSITSPAFFDYPISETSVLMIRTVQLWEHLPRFSRRPCPNNLVAKIFKYCISSAGGGSVEQAKA